MLLMWTALLVAFAVGFSVHAESQSPIQIALLVPQTGDLSTCGTQCGAVEAAKIAVDEINAAGGVLGSQLSLLVEDTRSDRVVAEAAIRSLLEREEVAAVAGALSSEVAMAVADVCADWGVPLLTPASVWPDPDSGSELVPLAPSAAAEGAALAGLALDWGYRRVAVVVRDDLDGRAILVAFQATFEAGGGDVAVTSIYEPGKRDFSESIAAIRSGDVEVVIPIAFPRDGQELISQMLDQQLAHINFIPHFLSTSSVIDALLLAKNPGDRQSLVGTYTSANSGIWAYDAVYLIALAAQIAGDWRSANLLGTLNSLGQGLDSSSFLADLSIGDLGSASDVGAHVAGLSGQWSPGQPWGAVSPIASWAIRDEGMRIIRVAGDQQANSLANVYASLAVLPPAIPEDDEEEMEHEESLVECLTAEMIPGAVAGGAVLFSCHAIVYASAFAAAATGNVPLTAVLVFKGQLICGLLGYGTAAAAVDFGFGIWECVKEKLK
jgi:ABC-type branched-subunit amino acid transport system substrate-binding protein